MRLDIYKEYEEYKALIGKTVIFNRKIGTLQGKVTKLTEVVGGLALSVDNVMLPSGKEVNNISCFLSDIVEVK